MSVENFRIERELYEWIDVDKRWLGSYIEKGDFVELVAHDDLYDREQGRCIVECLKRFSETHAFGGLFVP